MVKWLRIRLPMQRTRVRSGRGTKIPHATGQLSPSATTTEPVSLSPCAAMKKNPHAAMDPAQLEKKKPK